MENKEKKKILIADDEKAVLDILVSFMSEDYHVESAKDGREALDKYSDHIYGVLTDKDMPPRTGEYKGGFYLVSGIREQNPEVPIIMLSGSMYPEEEQRAYDTGVNKVLPKPVNFKELYNTLEREIERYDAKRRSTVGYDKQL